MAVITADLNTGTRVEIRSGDHQWFADEPVDLGGTDTGPTPYELLLGSLAACTCITVSRYAAHKGIALDSVSTRYEYERVHSDDCDDCETDEAGWLDHVRSEVFIEGTFTEAERERLHQVAVRCPVHKTLAGGVTFTDRVVVG